MQYDAILTGQSEVCILIKLGVCSALKRDPYFAKTLYTSLVRGILEYGFCSWCPQILKLLNLPSLSNAWILIGMSIKLCISHLKFTLHRQDCRFIPLNTVLRKEVTYLGMHLDPSLKALSLNYGILCYNSVLKPKNSGKVPAVVTFLRAKSLISDTDNNH